MRPRIASSQPSRPRRACGSGSRPRPRTPCPRRRAAAPPRGSAPSRSSWNVTCAVPVDPEPRERPLDLLDRLGDLAARVGVLDPQPALAVLAAREQPVEEERVDAADVEEAGRARRHADDRRSWPKARRSAGSRVGDGRRVTARASRRRRSAPARAYGWARIARPASRSVITPARDAIAARRPASPVPIAAAPAGHIRAGRARTSRARRRS